MATPSQLLFASAVIAAWKADATMERIDRTCWPRMFIPFDQQARVWLCKVNRMASNAMWDGNERAAMNHMLKLGYGGYDPRIRKDWNRIETTKRRFAKHNTRMAEHEDGWNKSRCSSWGTVKPMGASRKARTGYR